MQYFTYMLVSCYAEKGKHSSTSGKLFTSYNIVALICMQWLCVTLDQVFRSEEIWHSAPWWLRTGV